MVTGFDWGSFLWAAGDSMQQEDEEEEQQDEGDFLFILWVCGFLSLSLLISLSIREGREGGGVMSDDTQREEMCVKMGGLVWNQEQKGN